jgi:hypothetical protein
VGFNLASARSFLIAALAACEIFASMPTARPNDLGLISKLGEFQKGEVEFPTTRQRSLT